MSCVSTGSQRSKFQNGTSLGGGMLKKKKKPFSITFLAKKSPSVFLYMMETPEAPAHGTNISK